MFLFSLQLLPATFLILKRTGCDMIISAHRSSCKVPVLVWNDSGDGPNKYFVLR